MTLNGRYLQHDHNSISPDYSGPFPVFEDGASVQNGSDNSRQGSVGATNGSSTRSWGPQDCIVSSETPGWLINGGSDRDQMSFHSGSPPNNLGSDREMSFEHVLLERTPSGGMSDLSSPIEISRPLELVEDTMDSFTVESDFTLIQYSNAQLSPSPLFGIMAGHDLPVTSSQPAQISSANQLAIPQATHRPGHTPPWTYGKTRHANAYNPPAELFTGRTQSDVAPGDSWFELPNNQLHGLSPTVSLQDTEISSPRTVNPHQLPLRTQAVGYSLGGTHQTYNNYTWQHLDTDAMNRATYSGPNTHRPAQMDDLQMHDIFIHEEASSSHVPVPTLSQTGQRELDGQAKLSASPSSPGSSSGSSSQSTQKAYRTQATNNRKHPLLPSKAGGRKQGSHLSPDRAQAANKMRKIKVCWHCKLQRDKCAEGDRCDRCVKRSQRPNADTGLGCRREHLKELEPAFRSKYYTGLHGSDRITSLSRSSIGEWHNVEITIHLVPGRGLPVIKCKVSGFMPRDSSVLEQIQYLRDPNSGTMQPVRKSCLPLGIRGGPNQRDDTKYDSYIETLMKRHMETFIQRFYHGENDDFGFRMLKLLTAIRPPIDSDEDKALHDAKHLLVSTFILSHTLTLAEDDQKLEAINHVTSFMGVRADASKHYTSPRLTNRQLKYHFSRLHENMMLAQLNRLQQIFGASKGTERWTSAFITILGLAIAFEDIQKNIHLIIKADTDKYIRHDFEYMQQYADDACKEIDRQFRFVCQIFKLKYRGHNPFKDCDSYAERLQDAGMYDFIRGLHSLVLDKKDFLQNRQDIEITYENWEQYTARLSGKFLLSFMI